jgi:hypothetical protein
LEISDILIKNRANNHCDKFASSIEFVGVSRLAKIQKAKYLSAINIAKLRFCAMMDTAQVTFCELHPQYKQSNPAHYNTFPIVTNPNSALWGCLYCVCNCGEAI